MIFGVMGGKVDVLKNLGAGNHGFVGGFGGVLSVFIVAGFSFQGTELVGITAGETKDPSTSIPKAINSVFWRILLFYIAAIAVISALIYYKNPNLLSADTTHVAISPFTLVFQRAGIAGAASIMNAVILTSILSSANSGTYASSRMLFAMAEDGNAPKIFSRTSKAGVPVFALIATTAVGLLAFIGNSGSGGEIFTWLVAASGLTGFIAWLGIAVSHYRFRRAFLAQGHSLSELPYVAKWFPAAPIIAFVMSVLVIVGQDYQSFLVPLDKWNWEKIGLTYISVPLFLILYFGYKIVFKTKVIPLKEVDLSTDHINLEADK
jgi:lysine-specific permease